MSRLMFAWFTAVLFTAFTAHAKYPHVVASADGTPISYEVFGRGEPALVFVHGWSCDGRYWCNQIPYFAPKHQVVILDLAGHGQSGFSRTNYTMEAFGADVRAVMADAGVGRCILIGHSMGGEVVAHAARGATNEILGLVGVDTFQNVAWPMTQEAADGMAAPLRANFPEGCRQFISTMLNERTPPDARTWILTDMSSAPSNVAMSAFSNMMSNYITGESARVFEKVRVPVVGLMADMWPIDYESNRKYMKSFETIMFEGGDHFLPLTRPEAFNQALEKTISQLSTKE